LVIQHITPSDDKGGTAELQYRLLLVNKYKRYLTEKKAYVGAWCCMHAHFYNGKRWWWRLWYLAALLSFPRDVARARLSRSSLLARLRLPLRRMASS
jgi:hypothetical protein